jgi:hypothetical protein
MDLSEPSDESGQDECVGAEDGVRRGLDDERGVVGWVEGVCVGGDGQDEFDEFVG